MDEKSRTIPQFSAPRPRAEGDGVLRVLQLTDCHLYRDSARCLAGVNTQKTFEETLLLARTSFADADIVLATGDLVHDASPEGYRRLRDLFAKTNLPVYCLPGNHDIPAVMTEVLNESGQPDHTGVCAPLVKRHQNWVVIMLDSTIPGKEGGHLDQSQLQILEDGLAQHPGCHALICLHHHPVPIDSAWMDDMGLDNSTSFFRIVDRFPLVRGVIWGHIHQAFEGDRNGVKLLGCPSTCIQFIPGQEKFGLDQVPPGLRWMELLPDGEIRTGIQRLQRTPLELDLSVAGY